MDAPSGLRYQPFYCEENAWWLCADPALGSGERQVAFITSRAGLVPMLQQRAGPSGRLIAWDYHAVVADAAGRGWDQDSRPHLPTSGPEWLKASFALAHRLPSAYAPRLRIVSAEAYRRDFASDRSHMRDRRLRWRHPPPPWAAIGSGMSLARFLNPALPEPGRLMDLAALREWFVNQLDAGLGSSEQNGPLSMEGHSGSDG